MRLFGVFLLWFASFICATQVFAKVLDDKEVQDTIQEYEPFFREALLQEYESSKIQRDSKSGLVFIDFCQYPPDRSLPFGALENGRWHGNKIQDLPFPCDTSSGAKKYFIPNASIEKSYKMIQSLSFGALLPPTIPSSNTETLHNKASTKVFWQHNGSTTRLWILYRDMLLDQSCAIIFATQGAHTSIFIQYRNM